MTAEHETAIDGAQRCHHPLCIAADHPVFKGHFPDAPVVPGVLVLSKVLDAAEKCFGPLEPVRLRQAKFPAPWLPGVSVVAMLERTAAQLRFEVKAQDHTLALGVFDLEQRRDEIKELS